ncbi:hypothetical protein DFH29DRAFT_1007462 [Suillus ampliporus]|nr:hypothetical protein DFH29DRAFT_1007462 [Suillus ampliporus]
MHSTFADNDPLATRATLNTITPDSLTYPWPSKAPSQGFCDALLFSSPRLPFSDTQKKAYSTGPKNLDYGNPLTRFAMQDYPEDGGKGMSQVFNGKKMLLDLPSPPAARVDGKSVFSFGSSSVDGGVEHCKKSNAKILYALGRAVQRTDAGFIVNDEQEIIPTSMFVWSYEDIASMGELDCGLTGTLKFYCLISRKTDAFNSLFRPVCITCT